MLRALVIFCGTLIYVHSCPDGWTRHVSSCYHVSRDTASWIEASRMCELHGSMLVKVDNADEQNFIEGLIGNRHLDKNFWLGGSDWTIEGKWVWEPLGTGVEYTNWDHNEPDNSGNSQHCLSMDRRSGGKWDDKDCKNLFHYICEMSNPDVSLNTRK